MDQLEPNTKEWLEHRRNFIGASDAAAVMGVSPWKTCYQLWEDKLGIGVEQKDNWAMKRGRELEPVARDAYIVETGNMVAAKMVIHPKIKYMMANFDGITKDHKIAVEIKCPGEPDHYLAKEGMVPEKYMPQLQHQMAVIGVDELHYFSFRDGDTVLLTIKRDDAYIKKMIVEQRKFWKCVENLSPPPLSDKDYNSRHDLGWASAAAEWTKAHSELEAVEKREAESRELLIKLSENQNTIGQGVRLQKIVRKGKVDYKAIPELKDVDLDKYRKDTIESWRIGKC